MATSCEACGHPLTGGAAFCSSCGRRVAAPAPPAPAVSGLESAAPGGRPGRPHLRRRGALADERILWSGSISVRALLPHIAVACAVTAFWLGWLAPPPSGHLMTGTATTTRGTLPSAALPFENAPSTVPLSKNLRQSAEADATATLRVRSLGAAGVWGALILYVIYRKLDETFVLTHRRMIHEQGILRRVTNFIEVIDIDDVGVDQTLWDRLLGIGAILVESSDRSHPLLVMRGMHPAADIASLIDDARHRERATRGVHVEMV